jgi:hypothetical protein
MLQVLYQHEPNNPKLIHWIFQEEAIAMNKLGIMIGTKRLREAEKLIFRGEFLTSHNYPKDSRFINTFDAYAKCLFIDKWYPIIKDLTIETLFSNDLDSDTENTIIKKGWAKAFIKDAVKSLAFISNKKSIWPDTSLAEMKNLFINNSHFSQYYSIRKYLAPKVFDNESRYWIINNNIYHPSNTIPKNVVEAANRLKSINNNFYVIDATPEIIIEVNPGETSIRYANNSAIQFAEWLKQEFN